jgi:hypothetical protein
MQRSNQALCWQRAALRRAKIAAIWLPLALISAPAFSQQATLPLDAVAVETALQQGILLFSAGDYQRAIEQLEPVAPHSAAAAEYLALARSELDQLANLPTDQTSPYAEPTDAIAGDLNWSPDPLADRRWNFTVITGHQFDSNVVLSPDFVGLGAPTNMADSSWFVASFGDYRLIQDTERTLGLIMSTYDNFYFDQTNFDLQDYMLGGYYNWLHSENWIGAVRYEFHETLLDYRQFAFEHRLVPNLTYREGDFGHTTFYYEYDSAEFDVLPLVPAQDRDADVHGLGVTQAIYTFCGLGRVFFGYRYENAVADGSDFDRSTNMVTARLERPLGERFVFDAEVRQFWDDYANPNTLDFLGRPRNDQRTEARTGLQWYFGRHASLRLDYTYINSNSNVANLFDVHFFQYNRHLVTSQFIYDF